MAPCRMSTEGARLGALWSGLTDQYMALAEEQGMLQDLMCRMTTVPNNVTIGDNEDEDNDSDSFGKR